MNEKLIARVSVIPGKAILLLIFLIATVARPFAYSQCKLDLRNKYLVYTPCTKTKDQFDAPFFYVTRNDTITPVRSNFGYRYEASVLIDSGGKRYFVQSMIPDASRLPYTLDVKDSFVYFRYYTKDSTQDPEIFLRKYSLTVGDTCYEKLSNSKWLPLHWFSDGNVTVNTGVDTTIPIYGDEMKCRKFLEYSSLYRGIAYAKYLEKSTFLPILVQEFYNDLTNPWKYRESYILRYLIDVDDVKTTEYYSPYDRIPKE